MEYLRMFDKNNKPTYEDIINYLGKRIHNNWDTINDFIDTNYDILPEIFFYGLKYGWCLRYRKNGKTFCTLFPENGAFTILIIHGKKEIVQTNAMIKEFCKNTQDIIQNTKQYHDGKWLWIRVVSLDDVDDVIKLLQIKKNPEK